MGDNRHTSRLVLNSLRWRGLIFLAAEWGRRLGLNGNLAIGSSMANERNSSGLGLNGDLAIGRCMANEGNSSGLGLNGDLAIGRCMANEGNSSGLGLNGGLAIGGRVASNDLGRMCLD